MGTWENKTEINTIYLLELEPSKYKKKKNVVEQWSIKMSAKRLSCVIVLSQLKSIITMGMLAEFIFYAI